MTTPAAPKMAIITAGNESVIYFWRWISSGSYGRSARLIFRLGASDAVVLLECWKLWFRRKKFGSLFSLTILFTLRINPDGSSSLYDSRNGNEYQSQTHSSSSRSVGADLVCSAY